jgi:hypothetical protein
VSEKIKTLLEIKERRYVAAKDLHPKLAASYAVTDILNNYRTQQEHLGQLLDMEIEDALKYERQTAGK